MFWNLHSHIPANTNCICLSIYLCSVWLLLISTPVFADDHFFTENVYPIFEAQCIECHGDTVQHGKLRLDAKAPFMQGGISGALIEGNDPTKSLLYQRITQSSPKPIMPMGKKPLTKEELAIIAKWIQNGAQWDNSVGEDIQEVSNHWAFEPVKRVVPPTADWGNNPIDAFIYQRLKEHELEPSPEADKAKLIRRMYLDVIGLPPSVDELNIYLNDTSDEWKQRLIEDLLASPHYGEKWGKHWLDAARYADTNGYEKDRPREIWAYRDYVINSFNDDKPFDQFTMEQLAGDLLPNAGLEQLTATGFHRNTMHNEEGGVDVEEFRFESLVDRVNTTSTIFLGLTMACAQCHAHKYEPISQQEYYQFYAYFNQCDEVSIPLPDPEIHKQQLQIKGQISQKKTALAEKFPAFAERIAWDPNPVQNYISLTGSVLDQKEDWIHTINPTDGTQQYLLMIIPEIKKLDVIRFTYQEIFDYDGLNIQFEILGQSGNKKALSLKSEESTIYDNNNHNTYLSITSTEKIDTGSRFFVRIESESPLPPFQIQVGYKTREPIESVEDIDAHRKQRLEQEFTQWLNEKKEHARDWKPLHPVQTETKNHTLLKPLPDQSLLAYADMPNSDVYTVWYDSPIQEISALQLSMLRHPDLPDQGPGRGTVLQDGNFMLSEMTMEVVSANGSRTVPFSMAKANSSARNATAGYAIDDDHNTGWSITKNPLLDYQAVFRLKEPITLKPNEQLKITFNQNYIHTYTMGRFRVAVSGETAPDEPTGLPAVLETILVNEDTFSPYYKNQLKEQFLISTSELLDEQQEIQNLYASIPQYNTTLVVTQRDEPRDTHLYYRGEYLHPRDTVEPGVPVVLHPIQIASSVHEPPRLQFARWIASEENPLIARVTVNRIWHRYFGRGIVNSIDDFGTRGELPTHPELLDWLATEFMDNGWSLKHIHQLILSSATYQQSPVVNEQHKTNDPNNEWYARGPRFRIDAELIRDTALKISGLLSPMIGGPSVFPPIPDGLGALSYGGLRWNTDTGANRFRRGLYTYWKRTNPYPMLTTFDAPLADTACVRRNQSNTPLQALTLMNDTVFVEASYAFAKRILTEVDGTLNDRIAYAFQTCTSRIPTTDEIHSIARFYGKQYMRVINGEIDPLADVAIKQEHELDPYELSAWTTVARVLLNLDETVTKE